MSGLLQALGNLNYTPRNLNYISSIWVPSIWVLHLGASIWVPDACLKNREEVVGTNEKVVST